ncbi:hypothetical protein [Lysinibacillus xylanilyticus]|uniref:hypothetical protein n=1 Tax=Lysinibacillus xylanilyticus TaxID=582475 RepID=UPI00083C9C77|nr:hypothetical protein [Lysinibacillus xylanilyticus]
MEKQEKKKNGRKQVDALHLIYLGIITGGLIVLLLSYIFGESIKAGSHLNFAATLTSILLAVIAIVITLIDVAGQRSNIFDVKNSVENLQTVSVQIEEVLERYNEQSVNTITQLMEIVNELGESHKEMASQMSSLTSKIENIPSEVAEVQELKEEAKKVNEKFKDQDKDIFIKEVRVNGISYPAKQISPVSSGNSEIGASITVSKKGKPQPTIIYE